MDKLIFLLNTSWQWGLIVGIVWLLVYQLRRAHAICYALWLTALVTLPILLGLNAHPARNLISSDANRSGRECTPITTNGYLGASIVN